MLLYYYNSYLLDVYVQLLCYHFIFFKNKIEHKNNES